MNLIYLRQYGAEPYFKGFDPKDSTRRYLSLADAVRPAQKARKEWQGGQGLRSAVTGGPQMDGFIDIFTVLITWAGIREQCIFRKKAVELPGFFRPTKEWDLLSVRKKALIAAIEAKSQAGPSFGKKFNNRTEEAMGSALDLWMLSGSALISRVHSHSSVISSC